MENEKGQSFAKRFSLAMRVLFNKEFANRVRKAIDRPETPTVVQPQIAVPIAPSKLERSLPSALFTFAALQREGRFIDFLQQDVAGFSDEEVGTAARVVHGGCRKVLQQYLSIEPVLKDAEG